MVVIGISDLAKDPSVAAVGPAAPIAAIEEMKLSRAADDALLPRNAMEYCLRESGVRLADVSCIALAHRPRQAWMREEQLRLKLLGSGSEPGGGTGSASSLSRQLMSLRMLRRAAGTRTPIKVLEHHLCHAASAYYASEFDRALVLTLDGSGDMWSGMIAVGEGLELRRLRALKFPDSLGWLYTQVTEFLGFRPFHDEQKTQWLSALGEPDLLKVFERLFVRQPNGVPALDRRFLGRPLGGAWRLSPAFFRQLQNGQQPPGGAHAAAVAKSTQAFLEDTVVNLAENYRRSTGMRYLCLAGGVFLNVLLVRALEERTGFDRVFVQPASGNSGTALGAAYLARRQFNGHATREAIRDLHLGPSFDPAQIKAVLDNCKVVYRYFPEERDLVAEAASLLGKNLTVGWYHGRTEFGLRALGNRTILASPFTSYVTQNLNEYIKHREDFHPFVLSVPEEEAAKWFEFSSNCRFAASVGRLRDGVTGFEQFAFGKRLVRLHVVQREVNPRFSALLHKFGESAPAPVLVNTSFNLFGEPLVSDPRAAVRSFYCAGIDALVLEDFVVVK
jgi:carbamoyltransferase